MTEENKYEENARSHYHRLASDVSSLNDAAILLGRSIISGDKLEKSNIRTFLADATRAMNKIALNLQALEELINETSKKAAPTLEREEDTKNQAKPSE